MGPGMEEIQKATPSDAEEIQKASPPDAEKPETSKDNETAEEVLEESLKYAGNPMGNVYILVTAERITAGGLAAETAGKTLISNSFTLVDIGSGTENTDTVVGGMTGIVGKTSRIVNSYATGIVEISGMAGGFTAVNEGAIQECYSSMAIGRREGTYSAFTVEGDGELAGCVYDRQMACMEQETENAGEESGEFRLRGLNTEEMTGMEANVPGTWYLTEHAYPQIEFFAVSEQEEVMAGSMASAIALILPEGTTLLNGLGEGNIVLPSEIDGQEIVWEAEGKIAINENNQIIAGNIGEATEEVSMKPLEIPIVKNALERTGSAANSQNETVAEKENESTVSDGSKLTGTVRGAAKRFSFLTVSPRSTITDWAGVGESVENGTNIKGISPPTQGSDGYYEIANEEQLAWFAYKINHGADQTLCARLTGEINLFGTSYTNIEEGNINQALQWIPIGNDTTPYKGRFDGNGKGVDNLALLKAGLNNQGLFGVISEEAVLEDVGIRSGKVSIGNGRGGAGVVGKTTTTKGQILRCWNQADVSGTDTCYGGVSGGHEGSGLIMDGCWNTGTIKGNSTDTFVGGVVGKCFWAGKNMTVRNCYNLGNVGVGGTDAGGIVGTFDISEGCSLANCYNAGKVGGSGILTGSKGTISNCYYLEGATEGSGAKMLTDAQLKTWMAAYQLNGNQQSQSTGISWTIDSNGTGYPTLTKGPMIALTWQLAGQSLNAGMLSESSKPEGSGSETEPYLIENAIQLGWFAYQVNSGIKPDAWARLTNNIDLGDTISGVNVETPIHWIPIGTSTHPYTGTFDGNGMIISNMKVEQEGTAGLFGCVGGGTVIQDLGLATSCSVKNTSKSDTEESGTAGLVGSVVSVGGNAGVKIQKCYNRGTVEGRTGSKTGALVGTCVEDSSHVQSINSCYNAGLITAANGAPGALAGTFAAYSEGKGIQYSAWDSEMSFAIGVTQKAVSDGTLTGNTTAMTTNEMTSEDADSLIVRLNRGIMEGSKVWKHDSVINDGYPILKDGYVSWEDIGKLDSSKPSCKIPSSSGTAGMQSNPYLIQSEEELAWFAYQVNHIDGAEGLCAALTADISLFGEKYTDSKLGFQNSDLLKALNWVPIGDAARVYTGTFHGNGHTISFMRAEGSGNQGLFGVLGGDANIHEIKSASILIVSTAGNAGGIAGMITANGMISNAAVVDSTLISSRGSQGVIAGVVDGGTIFQCYSRGNKGRGAQYTGGIAGQLTGTNAEIRDCYNLETQLEAVGADSAAGGIAGDGSAGKIQNCYNACLASGSVQAEESAGGTAGSIAGKTGTGNLIQCYSDTDLSDSSQVTMFDTSSDAKRLEQTAGLNTYHGVERKGTDRVWYTSLVDEKTKGYPTFDAPVMLAVAVDPAKVKEVDGNVTGSIGEISGGTLPSSLLFRGIHQEKAADTEPMITLENKDNVTAQFHLCGTNSAHTQLSLIAGDQDLAGRNGSLTQPTDSITSFSAMTLYNGASYVYPYKRTLVVELAAKTAVEGITDITRYEITVEIAAVTGKTLDVTMKAQTMMELQPGVTGTAYTEDLELVNGNPYPIQLKISSLDPIRVGKDVVLQPIAKEAGIHNEKPLTEDGVQLGITKPAEGEDTGKLGTVGDLYYEPGENENPGTWMKGSLGFGSILRYRYFMKHSLLHVGPQQTFGFKITYEFRIPAENPEPGVSVSAG